MAVLPAPAWRAVSWLAALASWSCGPGGKPLPEGRLSHLGWNFPASGAIGADFDVCIENLRLLRTRDD